MSLIPEIEPMAKTRGRPKSSERDDITVKIDRTLAGRAKHVAHYRGITVAELLSELVKGPLDKAFNQVLRETEQGGKA